MTKNRRYEAYYDGLNDQRIATAPGAPCGIPMQAYGPEPVEWVDRPLPVWAWVTWADRTERVACFAAGWNDRVVFVRWYSPRGELQATAWRSAVTRRNTEPAPAAG